MSSNFELEPYMESFDEGAENAEYRAFSEQERDKDRGPEPKKKTTPFKPDHGKAAAKIYIDGLSILCFDDKQAEFVFVKDGHSPIRLRFYKTGGAEVRPQYEAPATSKVRITIKRWKAGNQHSPGEFYEEGVSRTDDEDFRWLPDICDWYGKERIEFRLRDDLAKNHLSAKLVIHDAVFYTRVKSTKKATLMNWGISRKEKIARVLGADILCDSSDQGIVIEIAREGSTTIDRIQLPLLSSGQYYILAETHPTSDHLRHTNPMPDVYNHIIVDPGKKRYYLEFEDEKDQEVEFDPTTDTFVPVERATEYACQSHGGGNGDPPDIP